MSQQAKLDLGGSINSFGEDTGVPVGPGGNSLPGIVHLPCVESKRGLHLIYHFFLVIHSRNPNQLLPPARCFICPSSPGHPLLQLFYQRFRGGHLHVLLFWAFNWPPKEAGDLWPESGGSPKLKSLGAFSSPSDSEPLWEGWYLK